MVKLPLNIAQGPFNRLSTTAAVLEGKCHHEREQMQFWENAGPWLQLCIFVKEFSQLTPKNSKQKEHISIPSQEEQVQWQTTSLKLPLKKKLRTKHHCQFQ